MIGFGFLGLNLLKWDVFVVLFKFGMYGGIVEICIYWIRVVMLNSMIDGRV